jgi:hypothetical protein
MALPRHGTSLACMDELERNTPQAFSQGTQGYPRGYPQAYSGVLTGRRERARAEHAAGLLALHLRSAPGRSAPREYPVRTPEYPCEYTVSTREYPILSGTPDNRRRRVQRSRSGPPASECVREGSAAQRV